MPRRRTEDILAELSSLEENGPDDALHCELRNALGSANNIVIAKAARIAGRRQFSDLGQPMTRAFARLMKSPAKRDKGCRALTDLAEALDTLEVGTPSVYLQGIVHVQMEPVYGGRVDTAAMLRARCALGLARLHHPQAPLRLTHLLVDPEPQPRGAAARGLGYLGGETAELLLRLKVLTGEEDPEVLSECFASLIAVAPERSIDFVAGSLQATDTDIAESAALALGESGRDDAYHALMQHWESCIRARDRVRLALPIALTKRPEARDFLVDVVASAPVELAAAAVNALRIFQWDEAAVERTRRAVAKRRDPKLDRALADWV